MDSHYSKTLKRFAFTLTEILIATTIVGVIAALVFPMLVSNYSEKAINDGFKREQLALEQMLSADAVIFYDTQYKSHNQSEKFIKKYFKINKYCGTDNGDCFAKKYYEYKDNDKVIYSPKYVGACAVLKNGMSICLSSDGNGTATALLDINGKKGPNVYGRDLRELTIKYDTKTKSISTESSTVYFDDTKIPDEDCTGDNYLSLECCKERGDIANNTACCVHSEISDEYPDVCNNSSGGGSGCSSNDTSEACCLEKEITSAEDVCCKYDSVKTQNNACQTVSCRTGGYITLHIDCRNNNQCTPELKSIQVYDNLRKRYVTSSEIAANLQIYIGSIGSTPCYIGSTCTPSVNVNNPYKIYASTRGTYEYAETSTSRPDIGLGYTDTNFSFGVQCDWIFTN
jgi:prepilin-type N-terminal cleavage/methylation domain-containing protein